MSHSFSPHSLCCQYAYPETKIKAESCVGGGRGGGKEGGREGEREGGGKEGGGMEGGRGVEGGKEGEEGQKGRGKVGIGEGKRKDFVFIITFTDSDCFLPATGHQQISAYPEHNNYQRGKKELSSLGLCQMVL